MAAAGPEALAALARPLTEVEQRDFDRWQARTVGMTDWEFAVYARVPVNAGRDLRRLLAGG
jgi:hypothetical protein